MSEQSSREHAVEMFVGGLVVDPNTQAPIVILKDEGGELCLPIWIGVAEATSIATALKQAALARPLTHDLMIDVLHALEGSVERIIITELREGTYFAELMITIGDRVLVFDSRPSDAIALAIRASAPIYVTNGVLEQAKIPFVKTEPQPEGGRPEEQSLGATGEEYNVEPDAGVDFHSVEREKWEDILNELDPDDFKYKM